jgi:AcrR family transcriptional regulator
VQRKTRAGGEKTRERILEAALPLFARHGYAGTSTRMVAGAAEVNVATLAYYFEGKEGLYHAVVQRLHEDLSEQAPAELPRLPPTELAPWLADRMLDFANAHRVHIRVLIRNVLDSGGHADVVMDRWTEGLFARADHLIGLARPEWSRTRSRLFALCLVHTVARFAIEDRRQFEIMAGGPEDLDAEIRGFLADLLRRELGLP